MKSRAFEFRRASLVENKPQKVAAALSNPSTVTAMKARFEARIIKREDKCWVLPTSKIGKYSHISIPNTGLTIPTHVFALFTRLGSTEFIEKGLFGLHRCDHPECVRPIHIYPGTAEDNARDRHRVRRNQPPPQPIDEVDFINFRYTEIVNRIIVIKFSEHLKLDRKTIVHLNQMERTFILRRRQLINDAIYKRDYVSNIKKSSPLRLSPSSTITRVPP